MKSVSFSRALPVAPPWVSNSLLLHQRFMLPEISFCQLFASEMINQSAKKTSFICQRDKLLGAEGLKHNLLTASIKDTSVARNLHSSVYKCTPGPGSWPTFCPASFNWHSFCNALAGFTEVQTLEVRQREFINHHPNSEWRLPRTENHK